MNTDYISEIMKDLAKQQEAYILDQLSDFVARGLIVLEKKEMVMTRDSGNPGKVTISESVRLVLKDKEYIEKLEKENGAMKSILETLKEFLNDKRNS